ncbi:MAG TPA: hypothetical protein VEI26_03810, partial [Terriglobales bacterium]|nr:hypothetical protein [Terriglobales bacterium]
HNTVSNNIVMNNGGAGIEEYSTQTGPNNVYLNNVVYNNGGGDIQLLTGTSSGTVTLTSAQAQNVILDVAKKFDEADLAKRTFRRF